jgi:chaperonin cofactor prefoldin
VNIEAQILDCMVRLRTLEAHARNSDDATITMMIGTTLVLADLAEIRAEMRQDHAALGDELAALRRHMNDHFSAIHAELHRLGVLQLDTNN